MGELKRSLPPAGTLYDVQFNNSGVFDAVTGVLTTDAFGNIFANSYVANQATTTGTYYFGSDLDTYLTRSGAAFRLYNDNNLDFEFNATNAIIYKDLIITSTADPTKRTIIDNSSVTTDRTMTTPDFDLNLNQVRPEYGTSVYFGFGAGLLADGAAPRYNVAIGYNAFSSSINDGWTVAVGYEALKASTSAINTAVGAQSLKAVTSGDNNTAFGMASGNALTTGDYNTFIGRSSGLGIVGGNYNAVIGTYTFASDVSNNVVLSDGQGNASYWDDTTTTTITKPLAYLETTTAGITASVTQTQVGGVALTTQLNEVSTVANNGDTVTAPTVEAGKPLTIINNGANTLQIFPFSGDDLGSGVDVSQELQPNESVEYVGYDATNWHIKSSTEIIHAECHDEDNTDVFVINAQTDFHAYHSNGIVAGDLAGWTFDAGGGGTSYPIASIADAGGGDITVTTTGTHGLAIGSIITQTNLADAAYTGAFVVLTVPTTSTYTVTAVFTATDTGTMDQAMTLNVIDGEAGVYSFAYYMTATSATNNETFDFRMCKNASAVVGSKSRRKFGTGGDFGTMSGGGIVTVADGDKLSLALSNEDSLANITIRNLTIVLVRL